MEEQLLVFVFPDASVDKVRQHDHVVLCHVVCYQLGGEGAGEAATTTKVEVEAECDGDEESSDADHDDDELLAEESGEETASEESAKETIIASLRGRGGLISDWVVVIVVSLVADWSGLGGSVAVSVGCNKKIKFRKIYFK